MKDLPSINALKSGWYGPSSAYTPEHFAWAFLEREPEPCLLMGVEDGQKLVGTQAVLPIPCRQGETAWRSCKSEETLLDPEYRGKGLFNRLYDEIFSRIDDRIDVIWGETGAGKAFERCGFSTPATMRYTVAFTGPPTREFPLGEEAKTSGQRFKRRLFAIAHRLLRYKTALMLRWTKRDPEVVEDMSLAFYEAAWDRMTRQYPRLLSVDRTQAWLRWRLEKNPNNRYRMLRLADGEDIGALLFLTDESNRIVFLVDFVAAGNVESIARRLAGELAAIAAGEGLSLIIDLALDVDLAPQRARQKALRRFGSLSVPMPGLVFVRRLSPRFDPDDPRFDAQNWYYTYLMSDGSRV